MATILTCTTATILTSTFSVNFWGHMGSLQTARNPIFTVFSKEFCTPFPRSPPPQKNTSNTHNVAHRIHIKGPLFRDQVFLEKRLRAQTPKTDKKTPYTAKPFVLQCFEAFFLTIFAFLTKCPANILTSSFSCPLFLTSPPPPPKKNTQKHLFLQRLLSIQESCSDGFFAIFGCCIVVVLVVANLQNSKKHINKEKQMNPNKKEPQTMKSNTSNNKNNKNIWHKITTRKSNQPKWKRAKWKRSKQGKQVETTSTAIKRENNNKNNDHNKKFLKQPTKIKGEQNEKEANKESKSKQPQEQLREKTTCETKDKKQAEEQKQRNKHLHKKQQREAKYRKAREASNVKP